jgi:CDP-diacylglycerol--serine O-phosphatidyltransferase
MSAAPIHDFHRSNTLTYVALASAVGGLTLAFDPDRTPLAAAALGLAAIADTFDGRFARSFTRTPRQAQHGKEIDSLVDAIAFGVAPVAVLCAGTQPAGWTALVWWGCAIFYAASAVTRLAHFNVEDDHTRFTGIPTPAAALLCLTSLLIASSPWVSAVALAAAGAGMVAPLPIRRPRGIGLVVFAAWALVVVVSHAARYARGPA